MGYKVWVAISFLSGQLLFYALPVVVTPSLPSSARRKVGAFYFQLAQQVMQRGMISRRKLGGLSLIPSTYDSKREGERVTLGGERLHFDDPHNLMSRFCKLPFSLTYEGSSSILDPRIAEAGEHLGEWAGSGEHKREINGGRYYSREFTIPEGESLVDPKKALSALPGSASPKISDTAWEYGKESQSGFRSVPLLQAGSVMMMYGLGVASVWFLSEYGTGVAPNVSSPVIYMIYIMGAI